MRDFPAGVVAVALAAGSACAAPVQAQDRLTEVDQRLAALARGDTARAVAVLEDADRAAPDEPTTLRLLGTAYAFDRQYDRAIAVLTRARALAPRDQDIALALARAYLWSGQTKQAAAIAREIDTVEPANPELPALVRSIETSRHAPGGGSSSSAYIGHSLSRVKSAGGRRTWNQTTLGVVATAAQDLKVTAEVVREVRASVVDTGLQGRIDRRLGRAGNVYLSGSATPKPDFRSRWSLGAGGEAAVHPWLSVSLDARYAAYTAANTTAVSPGLRLQRPDNALAVSVQSINLWTGHRTYRAGWATRAEAQASHTMRLLAGVANYPDTESGVTRRVRSAFAGGILELGNHAILRLTLEHERRTRSYTRNGAAVGVSIRF